MLKYLVIPLAHDAVSFCQYEAYLSDQTTIPAHILSDAIVWAMKENLSIQFIFPKQSLPNDIIQLIESVEHAKIVPSDINDSKLKVGADIVVFNGWNEIANYQYFSGQSYVIRSPFSDLLKNSDLLISALAKSDRINIVITDIQNVAVEQYGEFLYHIALSIIEEYRRGHQAQFNLLTDRLMLNEMNNCNAGYESLTLAPDGQFYICPAFWMEGTKSIGNLEQGLDLKNPQLFRLTHAPVCRECDAWQCKRCIWLNKKMTREVNTPSHEQCVISHIERNASKALLGEFRKIDPKFMPDVNISDIDYLDPFEKIINKQ